MLNLLAKLGLDITDFQGKMDKAAHLAKEKASEIGSELKGKLGALFAVGAIEEFARQTVEAADRISDLAEQMSMTTTEVQHVEYAMKHAGLQFDDFATSIDKFDKARLEVTQGNEKMAFSLVNMKFRLEDIMNPMKRSIDLLKEWSKANQGDRFSNLERAEISSFFGKRGPRMLGALAEGIDEGPAALSENIKALHDISLAMSSMWQRTKTGAIDFAGGEVVSAQNVIKGSKSIFGALLNPNAALGNFITQLSTIGIEKPSQPSDLSGWTGRIGYLHPIGPENKIKEAKRAMVGREDVTKPQLLVDDLARIGGFTSGVDQGVRSILQQQLAVQESIERNTGEELSV